MHVVYNVKIIFRSNQHYSSSLLSTKNITVRFTLEFGSKL